LYTVIALRLPDEVNCPAAGSCETASCDPGAMHRSAVGQVAAPTSSSPAEIGFQAAAPAVGSVETNSCPSMKAMHSCAVGQLIEPPYPKVVGGAGSRRSTPSSRPPGRSTSEPRR
jgi:hypothetical protein